MKISINQISISKRIPVRVSFNTSHKETYQNEALRQMRMRIAKEAGFIKPLIPIWYKETIVTVRNQTVGK
jgi:hypothetical protein